MRFWAKPVGTSDQVSRAGADLNLSSRAAAAARAELRGDRIGILGAVGESTPIPLGRTRTVPDRWSFIFVMERMEEAFRILARLPMPSRPRGYLNSMPVYLYDRGDLNSQLETYELERLAKLRNRVRIPPSPAEIAQNGGSAALAVAVSGGTGSRARRPCRQSRFAVGGVRSRHRQGAQAAEDPRRTFNARRLQGLRIIERELIRRRVPVR